MWKIEANNWGKEKRDYIKEALEYTGKEAQQLQRSLFVEKVAPNKWNYRLDTTKKYLEGIRNDYSYLNLSKNKTTTVMATQIALYKAWYMWVGHIDARWWSYTKGCIAKFQRENDLPVSWYLTKRTVDKLLAVAAEKQWLAPETRNQNRQEVKKPEEKPKTPTRKRPPISSVETKPNESQVLSNIDSTKIKNVIKEIWDFNNIERKFIIKNNKEKLIDGKKHLNIMGIDYEEFPAGESNLDIQNNTSKNWYHNAWDYFIFGKYINWKCYDWIKVTWDWENIIEKGEFNPYMGDSIDKWERIYGNWKIEKWTFDSNADWALKSWTVTVKWVTTPFNEESNIDNEDN